MLKTLSINTLHVIAASIPESTFSIYLCISLNATPLCPLLSDFLQDSISSITSGNNSRIEVIPYIEADE